MLKPEKITYDRPSNQPHIYRDDFTETASKTKKVFLRAGKIDFYDEKTTFISFYAFLDCLSTSLVPS